jgi:hypothetical protein
LSRGESKRAAGGRTWILIATHCFYLRPGLQMTNLGDSAMQSYSAQSQGRMQIVKENPVNLENPVILSN